MDVEDAIKDYEIKQKNKQLKECLQRLKQGLDLSKNNQTIDGESETL